MNPANYLFRLQKLDTKKDQVAQEIKLLEIKMNDDQIVIRAQAAYDQAEANCETAKLNLRQLEDLVQAQKIKIEQSESTLYSGTVKNPKELQDIQSEIASLKMHLSHLEDQQLEILIQIEDFETAQQNKKGILDHALQEKENEKKELLEKIQTLTNEANKLSQEYEVARQSVSPALLDTYLEIKKGKNGIAVSQIVEEACDICGFPITPGDWQSARTSSEIKYCPSCGRILYAS